MAVRQCSAVGSAMLLGIITSQSLHCLLVPCQEIAFIMVAAECRVRQWHCCHLQYMVNESNCCLSVYPFKSNARLLLHAMQLTFHS